ncbi:MAG: DNA recombination protein RmuC [Pseudomonadota bacterium]
MDLTEDNLMIIGAALTATFITVFILTIIAAVANRRRLTAALEAKASSEASLANTRAELSGQEAILDQVQSQLQQRLTEINSLQEERRGLMTELSESRQQEARLRTEQREREHRHSEQLALLTETRNNLKREFENLANRIFEDKGRSFTTTSQASLEALLKPFREQISGFQTRINEVHTESLKGTTALEKEIQKVLDIGLEMNSQASNLTLALKGDNKAAGNWGEAQLERTLELAGLQPGDHYEAQTAFRDEEGGRKQPDFVIRLPDNKSMVIDSKVSLVDYDRAVAAETEQQRSDALAAHTKAVRRHIDDLASKDYANLPGLVSPNFVLMFMAVEPAYVEAMKQNRDLFDYGYQKGVIMVSHTTLMPILRTVANLWMIDRSNKEAREISTRAGDIYNQLVRVTERLDKLGNTLRTAQNHYNDTVTSVAGKQGLHSKIERFAQISAKASKELPPLEPVADDIDNQRLRSVVGEEGGGGPSPAAEPVASPKVKPLRGPVEQSAVDGAKGET